VTVLSTLTPNFVSPIAKLAGLTDMVLEVAVAVGVAVLVAVAVAVAV
jgi:hypothetical protein